VQFRNAGSGRTDRSRRTRFAGVAVALVVLLGFAGAAQATHLFSDVAGHTTLERVITGADPADGYATLNSQAVNDSHVVRDGAGESNPAIPNAQAGRESRRRSLSYFGQLTDFQLADEESPARVEFTEQEPSGFAASAHRPQEALQPFIIDWSIRQMNLFAGASPVQEGDGDRAAMDFALITGDQADNMQRNETVWVRDILEGGKSMTFNTGLSSPGDYANPLSLGASCPAFVAAEGGAAGAAAEGAAYTGVQDVDDYPVDPGANLAYWDPDDVRGEYAAAGWPSYPGLMDHAQQITLTPAGLAVPFYLTNGNHDVLVQGNEDANAAFEDIATGCFKALGTTIDPAAGEPDPNTLLFPLAAGMLVPPDPQRQFVDKPQIKQIYGASADGDDDHGFSLVDAAQNEASNGSASYYAWNPPETPGFRFISIDTNSEGGVVEQSSSGNIDDPQFEWLRTELDAALAANKYVVVFGHHPVRSLTTQVPDEAAAPCTTHDEHGHDVNPGCDLDPRNSNPIHLGQSGSESFVSLIDGYQNVLAYVPGHTHENKVTPFKRTNGTVWWELNTSAVIDNPQQSRLIDIMDNRDGTISIFSAVLDHASDATAPAPGPAGGFDSNQLASIGRTVAHNDFQLGSPEGEGEPQDQNVELLIDNPLPTSSDVCRGSQATIVGSPGDDTIKGTDDRDVIVTEGGDDRVDSGGGNDLVCAGDGADKVDAGNGNDDVRGEGGRDKVNGGNGNDELDGQGGEDDLNGDDGRDNLDGAGARDKLNGGKGGDRVAGSDDKDRVVGGKGRDKLKGGNGNDKLRGGKGRDRLDGGPGNDRLRGGRSNDRCKGGPGRDRLRKC
jgi:hypothetical protein